MRFACAWGMAALLLAAVSAAHAAGVDAPATDASATSAPAEVKNTASALDIDLPRIPPTEPAQAQALFAVKAEAMLTLAASEPTVVDPVAMAFDEAGVLYVIEMRGYSEQDQQHLGRVRRLVDADHDGRFESSTVFAEGLSWPTAVCCYNGGVYVAAAPDVMLLRDTNGD
ncbi:MAG: hypothetical protein KDA37_11945, partial [Planctomycetales bacterium]|nr:hypothetical protein [Planctomycetales bacterium]